MKHRITTLDNGLRIVTATMPEARSLTAQICVGVGSRYEQYEVNGGIAHFLEHLFFKGTKKRPSTRIISEEIDAVGGYCNAYTANDITCYHIKVPLGNLELSLDILADMMTGSLFDADEIDRERGTVLEEINMRQDDPAYHVLDLTPRLLWPNHPLGFEVIGSAEVIKTVTRQSIVGYKDAHYGPQNMVVSVAGALDHSEVVRQVEKMLGGMTPTKLTKPVKASGRVADQLVLAMTKDTAQTHLSISSLAYPYLHANDPAARVVTTVLGRGLSSRLFLNVRERKGLAYRVGASLENFTDTGQFEVHAGLNLEKTNQAIEAILEELEAIRTQPIPAAELQKAKNQIRGGAEMRMESNGAVADRLGCQLTLLGKIKPLEQTLAEVDEVTVEDALRVAAEMLAPSQLRMAIIAPDPAPAQKAFEELTS